MTPLSQLVEQAEADILSAESLSKLEAERLSYLGKKGELTARLKALGQLDPTERPKAGQAINEAKVRLQSAIENRRQFLKQQRINSKIAEQRIDITLPGRGEANGALHPITQTLARIESLFLQMGFEIAEGPEIEDDFHNFEALNIPADHPARAMHDTFYTSDDMLLRTHTSSVQIRFMRESAPPFRFIAPGRVYRCDSDPTHTPMFHQVEGVMIDKIVNFAHLKGMMVDFLEHFFAERLEVRFRPSYFPFTEPSAEVDIMHNKRWLEVLGCGMVHPRVLENVGVDSEQYTGFAFGMGVERLAMLRHGIDDLRIFFENDLRFLWSIWITGAR